MEDKTSSMTGGVAAPGQSGSSDPSSPETTPYVAGGDESVPQQQPQTQGVQKSGDHGENVGLTRAVYVFAACAALNSCNLGYDIGVNTGASQKLQGSMGLSDASLEIFMGSLNLFAMLGALGSHFISDRLGRRGAFLVAAVGFIFGIFIMIASPNYTILMFGRVFVGLGVGFGLAVDPVYIAEVAPAAHRGRLVTWSEIATNVGILLGFMSSLVFYNAEDDMAWRGMFGLGVIMPSILICLVCFIMPESPRWLVQKQREDEAVRVLQQIYPDGYDVSAVVTDIKENIQRDTEAEHAVGWDVILFPSPAFRRMLLVGIGTAIAQQAVGIDAIQYFLLFILEQSGLENDLQQTAVLIFLGVIKLFFIVLAGRMFDTKGRRNLMMTSCAGMAFALFLLAVNFFRAQSSVWLGVFSLGLYLMFFSLGMGPGAWLIPSEVFATTVRAKAMSVASFMNRVTATLMSSTFLSTANAISYSGFFLVLSFVCIIVAAFFYFLVPETKGRSLEDMSLYFAQITRDRSILDLEERLSRRVGSGISLPPGGSQQHTGDASPVGTMA